ncbi:MAG: SpoIIE family protein phosphatase [Candidatus Riflebacteria bacterium]|nr:SpoIIE family protein phosphatase [Candidatus Riflebacteria bacterium]
MEFPRIRWLIFCIVFWGIPLALLWYGNEQKYIEYEAAKLESQKNKVERMLTFFDSASSPDKFFRILFDNYSDWVNKGGFSLKRAKSLKNYVNRRFPGMFKFTFLDSNGDIIEPLTDFEGRLLPRRLLKDFSKEYRDLLRHKSLKVNRKWKLYQPFFGPLVDPKISVLQDRFHSADFKKEKAFVYIAIPAYWGLYIVHFSQPENWDTIGASYLAENYNLMGKKLKIFTVDSESRIFSGKNLIRNHLSDYRNARKILEKSFSSVICIDGNIWAQRVLSPGIQVWAMLSVVKDSKILLERKFFIGKLFLCFFVLSFITYFVVTGKIKIYLSIHLKMVFLFLFSSALPVSILFFTASKYIQDRRIVLENKTHSDVEKALLFFDKNYIRFQGTLQAKLNDAFYGLQKLNTGLLEKAKVEMENICTMYTPTFARIFDENGNELWKYGGREVSMESFKSATRRVFSLMRKSTSEISAETESKLSGLSDISMAVAGFELETIFSFLAKNVGKLYSTRMSGGNQLTGFFPITDSTGKTENLGFFFWDRVVLEKQFVNFSKLLISHNNGTTLIYARNNKNHGNDRPKKFRNRNKIEYFLKKISGVSQSVFGSVYINNEKTLLTGVKGNELSEYNLVGLTSDSEITLEIKKLKSAFDMFIAATLLISLTVGGILARKFLLPVRYLGNGVSALKSREFSYRLPVLDNDELGDLSNTFNEMMTGLKDLEVAKIVQESLFPFQELKIGNYEIYGTCLSASEVGGDYFDYFPVSETKFAFLMGDVSGHGVGAAMVMAMAKAVVATPSYTGVDPVIIFQTMNKLFLETLKRKKMMTLFYGIVDCETNSLLFSNAGQCYPYLVRNGKANHIEMPGSPLGSRKKSDFKSETIDLFPNDTLVLYSDGLIEALAQDLECIGYERFEKALPELIAENTVKTENNIRQWHKKIALEGPLSDDITVLVLNYRKSSES